MADLLGVLLVLFASYAVCYFTLYTLKLKETTCFMIAVVFSLLCFVFIHGAGKGLF